MRGGMIESRPEAAMLFRISKQLALLLLGAFSLCSGLALGFGAGSAQERDVTPSEFEQRRERLRQEAIALFPTFLDGKLEKLDRCQISSSWLCRKIDEWDAREYFGVKAHASLFAPDHRTVPVEVLGPKGLYAKLFCNKGETEANNKQRFLGFEKAFTSDKSQPVSKARSGATHFRFSTKTTQERQLLPKKIGAHGGTRVN
jgi:hypothetical protein